MKEREHARKLFIQQAGDIGERMKKKCRTLTPEELMGVLVEAGSAAETAVLEAWHETGVGAFNETFLMMARFMTLVAVIDVLGNERSLSTGEITDLLAQLDREKAAWVFEILPQVLGE